MLYLFHWNSDYLVREKTLAWKKAFIAKHGEFNLTHINNILDFDTNQIAETLTAAWFFTDKKLVIIDNLPLSATAKNVKLTAAADFVLKLLPNLSSDTILVFSSTTPDKRSKLYKYLTKNADLQEFNSNDVWDISRVIIRKFPNKIDSSALQLLCQYKANNISKIISEIEKLLITRDKISRQDITDHIMPELEENIFQLIDDILSLNVPAAIAKMNIILDQTNIYGFYNNLLANLRTQIFISKAKQVWIRDVWNALKLWNRAFLANRSYKISHTQSQRLYSELIGLDKKMKTWKIIGSDLWDFQLEIEQVFLKVL